MFSTHTLLRRVVKSFIHSCASVFLWLFIFNTSLPFQYSSNLPVVLRTAVRSGIRVRAYSSFRAVLTSLKNRVKLDKNGKGGTKPKHEEEVFLCGFLRRWGLNLRNLWSFEEQSFLFIAPWELGFNQQIPWDLQSIPFKWIGLLCRSNPRSFRGFRTHRRRLGGSRWLVLSTWRKMTVRYIFRSDRVGQRKFCWTHWSGGGMENV